jgi:hypothetical protein
MSALLLLLFLAVDAAADPLRLSVADIDSLRCPPRDSILAHIQKVISFDAALQRQYINQALVAYARLEALRQELALLRREQSNLLLVYSLFLEKQKHSEVSDLEVLQSEQNYLNKQMAIVSQVYQIRETILRLCELAAIKIEL